VSTRFFYSGDQHKAEMLRRESVKHLDALKHQLSFNKLFQGKCRAALSDGSVIFCQVHGALSTISIYTPPMPEITPQETPRPIQTCWCTCCFSEGTVLEVIGAYHDSGDYGEETYPDYIVNPVSNIKHYNGIRYRVKICQEYPVDKSAIFKTMVCLASDWAMYEKGDKVIVTFLGKWNEDGTEREEPTPCWECETGCKGGGACRANPRKRQEGDDPDEPDGSFIIVPIKFAA
jgi:hypothetical protein